MDPKRRKNLSLILLNNGFYFMNNFLKRKRQRKRRSCWVKEWLNRCNSLSAYQTVSSELRLRDAEYFRRYLRMSTEVNEVKRFLQSYYHYSSIIIIIIIVIIILILILILIIIIIIIIINY